MQIAVDHHALHGLVALKTATDADEEARLRREAAVLEAAGLPGLVELIDVLDERDGLELRTRHVGTRTAMVLGGSPPASLAALGAGLAATLAELHRRGLSHGAVQADHVLLGAHGQPVLCSLGRVGVDRLVWGDRLPEDGSDERPFDPAGDVAALGQLLTDLGGRTTGWRTARGRRRLLALATAATADDPTARPTAAQLAVGLAGLSGARAPDRPAPAPTDDVPAIDPLDPPTRSFGPGPGPVTAGEGRTRRGRRIAVLAATTVIAGGATAALAVGLGSSTTSSAAASGPAPTTVTHETAPVTPSIPETAEAPAPAPAPTEEHVVAGEPAAAPGAEQVAVVCPATYDAAATTGIPVGCADVVRLAGRRVEAGPLTWDVGQDGDEVAVADVDCDGLLEVAVLRTSTAELFAFPSWAPPGRPATVTARPVPGAVSLVTHAGACGLSVQQPDGLPVAVDLSDLA